MVAADETILLTKQSGKHCRRRTTFARGVAVRSAEFEKSVNGVYPGCAGMGGYSLQRQPRTTGQKFGSSDDLLIAHRPLDSERIADALGIKIAGSGTTPNQILHSGEYLDLGTGNYDLRNRIYAQNTGTFLTADTTPGQLPYVYTSDNPVMFADPSGHDSLGETLGSLAINSILGGIGGGAVVGTYFHFTGGSVAGGFSAGFVFGGSLPFAIATGRVLEALTAGLLQGGISAAVDAVIVDNRGGIYGPEQASQDFLTGFSYGFASATWPQLFSPEEEWQLAGSALIGAFSSLLKSYAQHIAATGEIGDFSKSEVIDAFSNALSAGATSALLRAGLESSLPEVPGAIAQEVKIFATIVLGVEGDLIGAAFQEAVKLLG